jgi:hypothetical protein
MHHWQAMHHQSWVRFYFYLVRVDLERCYGVVGLAHWPAYVFLLPLLQLVRRQAENLAENKRMVLSVPVLRLWGRTFTLCLAQLCALDRCAR